MKVQAHKIDDFILKMQQETVGVLIYGPDQGLVDERAEIIVKKIVPNLDPFLFIEMGVDRIKDDSSSLNDEISAISFSTGRKLIKIRDAGDSLTKILKEIFENNISFSGSDAPFILVLSDDLGPRSSLRLFFEAGKNFAALPCYKDDEAALSVVIRKKLRESGFSFDNDVPEIIAAHSLGNRMIMMREMEKLSIYVGERKNVTVEDVEACVVDGAEASLEALVNAVADRDIKKSSKHLRCAIAEGIQPVVIFRYLNNYFSRLNLLQAKMQQGMNEQEAISSLRPPVFFKQVPLLKRHLSFWKSSKALKKALAYIYKGELESKKQPSNPLFNSNIYNIIKISG